MVASAIRIAATNFFAGRVVEHSPDGMVVHCDALQQPLIVLQAAGQPLGDPVTVAVQAERVALSRERPMEAANWVEGTLTDVSFVDGHTLFQISLADGMAVIADVAGQAMTSRHAPKPGETVYASWSSAAGVVLGD